MDQSKQDKYLNLLKSLNLPSNLLQQSQNKIQKYDSIKKMLTIDFQKSGVAPLYQQRKFSQPRSARYQSSFKSKENKKKMIIQNEFPEKADSLYKRLRKMRKQNQALQNFSLSKLLSKIKLLKDQQISKQELQGHIDTQMNKSIRSKRKNKQQRTSLKLQVYSFTQDLKSYGSKKITPTTSPKKNQQIQSSKIFRRYYCPPNTYKISPYQKLVEEPNSFLYQNGKKIECKRIHNFYSSHMYRRGLNRHCKQINQEEIFNTKNSEFSSEIKAFNEK